MAKATKTKAKTKPPATPKWLELECGNEQELVLGPAEAIVGWGGSAPTGKVVLAYTYWDTILAELPAHLRPEVPSDNTEPLLVVASDAAADTTLAELGTWLKARYPAMKTKRQKNVHLTRFQCDADNEFWIRRQPQTVADVERADNATNDLWSHGELLLWRLKKHSSARIRATPDGIDLVDTELDVTELDAVLAYRSAVTVQGTATCRGLFVVMWAGNAITDLRRVESAKVAQLAPLAGKVIDARDREAPAGGVIVEAKGTFRYESSEHDTARWIRLVRV